MEVVFSRRWCFANEYTGISARFLTPLSVLQSVSWKMGLQLTGPLPGLKIPESFYEDIKVQSLKARGHVSHISRPAICP